jgi:hypothetical protein
MRLKRYSQFIKENSGNIKSELISYFDSNKGEITEKGLDFNQLRENFTKSIDSLNPIFLQKITDELSSVDVSDKNEFKIVFENVLHEITEELQKSLPVTESFFSTLSSIWDEIKKAVSNAVKWISDRFLTISGILTLSLAGLLFVINQWGGGLAMPYEFGNVLVNTVLLIGASILKYGQKVDNYKNISEI